MESSRKKSVRLRLSLASFATLSLFASQPASGAVITFNASTGASETWGTNTNWSPTTVPGAGDDVIIDYSLGSTATVLGLDGTQAANSLVFGSANGPALGAFSLLANTTLTTARTLTLTTGNVTFDTSLAGAVTIGGTNGTLTLASGVTGTALVPAYTITNNSSQAVNLAAVITNPAIANTLLGVTYAGTGSGIITVSGANSYTGITTIGNVTVRAGNVSAFGASTNGRVITFAAGSTGTLQIGGVALLVNQINTNQTTPGTTFIENGVATPGSINFTQGSSNLPLSSTIRDGASGSGSGALSIVKGAGGNALILTGNNSYTGSTTISGGTLQIGNNGTTGTLGTASSIDNSGIFAISRVDPLTFGTTINNLTTTTAGVFRINGAGSSVTVTGNNTFLGQTQIYSGSSGGTTALASVSSINSVTTNATLGTVHSNSSNLGAPTTATNGIIQLGNTTQGGILRYTGTGETTDRTINLLNTATATTAAIQHDGTGPLTFVTTPISSIVNTSSRTFTLQGSASNGVFAAPITDNIGTDTITPNTFAAGTTTITTTVPGNFQFTATSAGTFANGANLLATGVPVTGTGIAPGTTVTAVTFLSTTGTGAAQTSTIQYTLSQATNGANSGNVVFSSPGTTGLTKAGSGTWTLPVAEAYTGATTINQGTLDLGGGTAVGSILASSTLSLGGGTLSYTTTGTNTQTFAGTAVATGGSTISNLSATNTIALGAITRTAGATVEFANAGTITTTTANNGAGILGGHATFNGTDWAANDGSGNITAYTGYTALPTSGGTATTTNAILGTTGTTTATGAITVNSLKFNTSGTLAMGTNALTLNGANGGLLVTANGGSITGTGVVGAGTTSEFIVNVASGNSFSISNPVVSGTATAGSLTKSGAGILTLTAKGNFTGAVNINGGTLVASGAAGANGALAGAVSLTINPGGALQYGNNTQLKAGATVTLNGGSLNTAGFSQSTLNANGTASAYLGALTLKATSVIDLGSGSSILAFNSSGTTFAAGTKLNIYNWSGNTSGGGTDAIFFGTTASGLTVSQLGQIEFYSGAGTGDLGAATILSTGEIVPLSAVPEPSTWVAGSVLLAFLGWTGLKRRRNGRSPIAA